MVQSPSEILGISPYASADEARKAYRALARRWHPDRFMPGPERQWAEAHMVEINTAYAAFIKGARERGPAGEGDLSRVQGLIDDDRLSTARELLMTMPTRCAEWNYLFGAVLMKTCEVQKALIYLSVAAHQQPDNLKYARALKEARNAHQSAKRGFASRILGNRFR